MGHDEPVLGSTWLRTEFITIITGRDFQATVNPVIHQPVNVSVIIIQLPCHGPIAMTVCECRTTSVIPVKGWWTIFYRSPRIKLGRVKINRVTI
jgi:hypothetical protein